jgi:hypothetical protein
MPRVGGAAANFVARRADAVQAGLRMEPSDLVRRRAQKLAETGYQCLRDRDAEGALKIAGQLDELRYTATFEIAALAHAQRGDLEAAVAVLRRGPEIAPALEEAVRFGEALLAEKPSEDPEELAGLAASVGSARLARGATADEILAFARDALDADDRSNLQLLALIRNATISARRPPRTCA